MKGQKMSLITRWRKKDLGKWGGWHSLEDRENYLMEEVERLENEINILKTNNKLLDEMLDRVREPALSAVIEYFQKVENYFETKEEAEKAVEKLKAWKRLKDKGLKITGYGEYAYGTKSTHHIDMALEYVTSEDRKDLDLLFSGEDEDELD